MSKIFYVNINNNYSNSGNLGTNFDPYNWREFLNSLSADIDSESKTYYLSGVRFTSGNDVNINVGNSPNIIINSWSNSDNIIPWAFNHSAFAPVLNESGYNYYGIKFYFNLDSSYIYETENFNIYNGFIECSGGEITFASDNNKSIKDFYADNIGLKATYIIQILNFNQTLINSNLFTQDTIYMMPYLASGTSYYVELNNCIISCINFYTTGKSIVDLTFDNCVISNNFGWSWLYSYPSIVTLNLVNCQSGWVPPSVVNQYFTPVSSTSTINYLNYGFNSISASIGNRNYVSNTFFGGTRDGVGSLYFPTISSTDIYASVTSGDIPLTSFFNIDGGDPFSIFSASSGRYRWSDNTSDSYISNNSLISHVFTSYGIKNVSAVLTSKNSWYEKNLNIKSIYVVPLSNLYILDLQVLNKRGEIITSAKPISVLTFSATVNPVNYSNLIFDWNLGDNKIYSITGTNNIQDYYEILGNKNIILNLYDELRLTSATYTKNFGISASSDIYYVNIVSAYDNTSGNGTSSSPYNFNQFYNNVKYGGDGEFIDIYNLSGNRDLIKSHTDSIPWSAIDIDYRKNFLIKAWNPLLYGPWVLSVNDYSYNDENSILSFKGCTLKDGIIYNKSFSYPGKGGRLIITNTYDMFVVMQGEYGRIEFSPNNYNIIQNYLSSTYSTSSITYTSSVSSNAPSGVYMSTFIRDDFSSSGFDSWWSSAFTSGWKVSAYPPSGTNYVAVRGSNGQDRLTSANLSGDFDFEFSVIIGNNVGGENVSIHMLLTTGSNVDVADFGWAYNNIFWNWGGINKDNYGYVLNTYDTLRLRMYRDNGMVSALYYNGSNWVSMLNPFPFDGSFYIRLDGADKNGIGNLYLQSEYGLKNYTSAYSATYVTSSISISSYTDLTPYYEIASSGNCKIYGCTFYSEEGYSDVVISGGLIELVDSLILGFQKINDYDFSSVNIKSYNCVYDKSQVDVENILDEYINNQYYFTVPSDYPFKKDNHFYGKNISYILSNRNKLKPFLGIDNPPNPGYNFSAYQNYETGLFGYNRIDYLNS